MDPHAAGRLRGRLDNRITFRLGGAAAVLGHWVDGGRTTHDGAD